MKSPIRYLLATAAVILMAQGVFAALSPEYANFGKGPAQFLMTKDEVAKWNAVKTDQEAKAFIDLFWLRRDPSPNTPKNEFKDAVEQRIKLADERFGSRRMAGSMTDRGHMLVVLGQPTEAVKQEKIAGTAGSTVPGSPTDDVTGGGTPNMPQTSGVRQTFSYDPAKIAYKPLAAALGFDVLRVPFVDPNGGGDFRLERSRKGPDFNAIYEKVVAAYVVQPNASLTQATAVVPKGPAPSAIKTAALQAAVDDVKSGKAAASKNISVAYAEFVSPAGDYFVPVTLYVPKSAGLTADAADTFFGAVTDSTGAQVFAFEEPAKLTVSLSDFFVDKTLNNVGTGKYTIVVGLAKAGAPVALTTRVLDLNEITKDTVGTSKLILSNHVYEMTEAAPVKSPFAFGRLKIVPKADLIFSNKDELTYFVELHNPGMADVPVGNASVATTTATAPGTVASATKPQTQQMPKFQVKLELSGGKLVKPIAAPLSDAVALPLSGVAGPGQYAVISSIPLGEMKTPLDAGDYTLKMKLIDSVTKQSYTLEQSFKIGL